MEKVYLRIGFNDPEEFESFFEAGYFLGLYFQNFHINLNEVYIYMNTKEGLIEIEAPIWTFPAYVYRTSDFLDFKFTEEDHKELILGLQEGFTS